MSVRYQFYNTGDVAQYECGALDVVAMTFTTVLAHTIKSVKLKIYRDGLPGLVTIQIKGVDGAHKPAGPVLTSGTIDGNSLPTSATWTEINLTPYDLGAGVEYAIILSCPATYTKWRVDTTGAYAGGNACMSYDGGGTWDGPFVGEDLMFEEWGDPISGFVPHPSGSTGGILIV